MQTHTLEAALLNLTGLCSLYPVSTHTHGNTHTPKIATLETRHTPEPQLGGRYHVLTVAEISISLSMIQGALVIFIYAGKLTTSVSLT